MVQHCPKWFKIVQNDLKWCMDPKRFTIAYNGPMYPKMVHSRPEWVQTNGPKWSKIVKMVQNGP